MNINKVTIKRFHHFFFKTTMYLNLLCKKYKCHIFYMFIYIYVECMLNCNIYMPIRYYIEYL